jgi:hypothetical protein
MMTHSACRANDHRSGCHRTHYRAAAHHSSSWSTDHVQLSFVSECFKSQTTTGWRALPAVSAKRRRTR